MINNQVSLNDLKGSCGKFGSIQCDGSGAIAIYNVLKMMGKENVDLDAIISYLQTTHRFIFGGMGDLNPFCLRGALKNYGIKSKYYGTFRSIKQLANTSHKFIVYYYKNFDTYFQAGHLVKDKTGKVWIEMFNPFHRYSNLAQFKEFEGARNIKLFIIEKDDRTS